MAKKHMKKCSTSLAVKEMKIKSTQRFQTHPLEWLPSESQTTTLREDSRKKEPSYTVGGNVN
jgi:hypothetical protein